MEVLIPNIRTFDAGNLGLQPTETGIEATAMAARRIGVFYNQAAEAVDTTGQRIGTSVRDAGAAYVRYEDHREIDAGAAHGVEVVAGLNAQWNDAVKNADPNDPSVAAKFREETLEPALQKFQEGFTTENSQRWADNFINQYREHFFHKSSADMSSLAKQAVQVNTAKTINGLVSTVYDDPSGLDFARNTLRHSIEGRVTTSPTLSADDAGRVRTEIGFNGEKQLVHAAISGAIARGGDWKRIADDPQNAQYIDRPELESFVRAEKATQRTILLQQKQLETYQLQQDEHAVKTSAAKIVSDNVSIDAATGRVTLTPDYFKQTLDLVRKYPNAPNAADVVRSYLDWGERQQAEKREPVVSNTAVKADLDTRMFSAENPTSEIDILKAETRGDLSRYDASTRLALVKALADKPLTGPIWRDTIDAVKGTLGTDPIGHDKFGQFVQAFIPEYIKQSRAGTLPPNALDVRDPNSMISQAMAPYRRDPMRMFMDRRSQGLFNGFLGPEAFLSNAQPSAPTNTAPRAPGQLVRQNGYLYQHQPDGSYQAIEEVQTPADASKLNPGTRYITPDGKIFRR